MNVSRTRRDVFLSAVTKELGSYRSMLAEALKLKLPEVEIDVTVQDSFGLSGRDLLLALDQHIAHCDAVFHLVGDATGVIVEPHVSREMLQRRPGLLDKLPRLRSEFDGEEEPQISVTQWEAYLAVEHGRRLFVFEADDDAPRDPEYRDDRRQIRSQIAHLERIQHFDRRTFATPESLRETAHGSLLSVLHGEPDDLWRIPDRGGVLKDFAALTEAQFQLIDEADCRIPTVGFRPSLRLLQERQYIPRRDMVLRAAEELTRLLELREEDTFNELEVFWIHGKSGCGKSVLLLYLMEEMVRRSQKVVWLMDDTHAFMQLLRMLDPKATRRVPTPDLIFVDDLYSPRGQEDLDVEELRRLVGDAPDFPWPVIATCGPPEFSRHFAREAARDSVRLHPWLLPGANRNEVRELRTLLEQRGVEVGEPGKACDDDEALMVSVAYEAQTSGRREPFAARFRQRLEARQLDKCLRVPLALNRLYITSPASWLGDRRAELEELNTDNDFRLDTAPNGADHLRLTHPHISDDIYRALRDLPSRPTPQSRRLAAEDLAAAVALAWQTDLYTLRQLLRVLAEGHERLKDVDMDHLLDLVARDWPDKARTADVAAEDPRSLAHVRVTLACWHAAAPELQLEQRLGQPLLAQALAALAGAGPSFPRLWEKLRNSYQGSTELLDDALAWLPESLDHSGWSIVWENVWNHEQSRSPRQPATTDHGPLLVQLAWQWLASHPGQRDWHFVWNALLRNLRGDLEVDRDRLLSAGRLWLTGEFVPWTEDIEPADHSCWPYLIQDLLTHPSLADGPDRNELLRLGSGWLQGRESRKGWPFVWQCLQRETRDRPSPGLDRADLIRTGTQWLHQRRALARWSMVWEGLLDDPLLPDEERGPLLEEGHRWLADREDHHAWPFVWQGLMLSQRLPSSIDPLELQRRGQEWLNDREDLDEWTHVWLTLVRSQWLSREDRDRLLLWGRRWLDDREDARGWTFVWNHLISEKHLPSQLPTDELVQIGVRWLAQRDDHEGWGFVWNAVSRSKSTCVDRPRLLRRGAQWLDGRLESNGWNYVWQRLVEEDSLPEEIDREALLEAGYRWLAGNSEHDSWSFVWQSLAMEGDPPFSRLELLQRGQLWMQGREERRGWSFVWQDLLRHANSDDGRAAGIDSEQLLQWGRELVHRSVNDWTYVWQDLMKLDPVGEEEQSLLAAGIRWLTENRARPDWTHIWEIVIRRDRLPAQEREPLLQAGLWWIQNHPRDKPWTYVWNELVSCALRWPSLLDVEQLADLGADWLRDNPDHPAAPPMIAYLVAASSRPDAHDDLVIRLTDWLADNPHDGRVQVATQFLTSRPQWMELKSRRFGRRRLAQWVADRRRVLEQCLETHQEGGRLSGTIVGVTKGGLVVDLDDWPIFAFLPASQIDTSKPDDISDFVGKHFEFEIESVNEGRLSLVVSRRVILERANSAAADAELAALEVGQLVRGKVANIDPKIGLFIEIGSLRGLLHRSELAWGHPVDPCDYAEVGEWMTVRVLRVEREARQFYLGLETPPTETIDREISELEVGQVVEGIVANVDPKYGLFIRVGAIIGLLHSSELTWGHCRDVHDFGTEGDSLKVKVLRIDADKRKVYFGLKQLVDSPWDSLHETLPIGSVAAGEVLRLMPYGAFVQLDHADLVGLLHNSELSWTRRVKHPGEMLVEGQRIEVSIYSLEPEKEAIGLSLKRLTADPWPALATRFSVGSQVTGTVENVVHFGVFIELEQGVNGLLHESQIPAPQTRESFAAGQKLELRVVSVDAETHNIGLSLLPDEDPPDA